MPELLSDDALATGAAGPWALLTENANETGYWPTLLGAASALIGLDSVDVSSFGNFNSSRNHLEDILGTTCGIALGSSGEQRRATSALAMCSIPWAGS